MKILRQTGNRDIKDIIGSKSNKFKRAYNRGIKFYVASSCQQNLASMTKKFCMSERTADCNFKIEAR